MTDDGQGYNRTYVELKLHTKHVILVYMTLQRY